MARSVGVTLGLALGLVTAALGSCKDDDNTVSAEDAPETFAQAVCAIYYDCACDSRMPNRFSSQEDCELEVAADLQGDIDAGEAAGLTYHGDCVGDGISALRDLGCASVTEIILDAQLIASLDEVDQCKLFSGTRTAGQPCESQNTFSGDDCETGLRCENQGNNSVCAVIEPRLGAGESCNQTDDCEVGLICLDVNGGNDQTCRALPDDGETCLGVGDTCGLESYCDQASKTCRALPSTGDCAPTPSILLRRCANGFECDANDVCQPSPGGGESCVLSCQTGFTCQAGVCAEEAPIICAAGV